MENFERTEDNGRQVYKRARSKLPPIKKSLAVFIACLQGEQIVIELKDDSEISGKVEESDKGMNVVLVNAKHIFCDGTETLLETAFVNGSSIRYVHFAHHIKPTSRLSEYLKKTDRIVVRSKPHQIKDRVRQSVTNPHVKSSSETISDSSKNNSDKSTDIYLNYGFDGSGSEEECS